MNPIRILDKKTIDKISAGEVVERPVSVVKELLENSIDAGSRHISVELKDGGISMIRVTDDGSGIDEDYISTAFLPHATSKLLKIEDLDDIRSLGFRGEALSSIAAVSEVELITKTEDKITGVRYVIEGGEERVNESVGVPNGTTIIVRNIFFNTPARRKFLKSANTEGSQITSLIEHLALSYPGIAFKYTVNGKVSLNTRGNGDLKEVIYRIYGREIADNLIEIDTTFKDYTLKGYIAKPVVARKNRLMENYFVNGRYIEDRVIARAIEEGYVGFLMQHMFPCAVLMIEMPPAKVDVNVHPRKMEVKFSEERDLFEFVRRSVADTLSSMELINDMTLTKDEIEEEHQVKKEAVPEPFESNRIKNLEEPVLNKVNEENEVYITHTEKTVNRVESLPVSTADNTEDTHYTNEILQKDALYDNGLHNATSCGESRQNEEASTEPTAKPEQLNLFEEKILSKEASSDYRIVGQVFGTYWIIEYGKEMLLIDQHAAHEKVMYERLMKALQENVINSQLLSPPLILTLTGAERAVIDEYMSAFTDMGFEIEDFGGNDIAIRAIPTDLYGLGELDVFRSMLDELGDKSSYADVSAVHDRIATMSCKAAVKGNTRLSFNEAQALIDELLSLDQPYNCPHGRPTIIKLSERELEKRFKRIV